MSAVVVRLANWAEVCRRTGVTYRQLDYWIRAGYIWPSQPAQGSGSRRGFGEDDVAWISALHQARQLGFKPEAVGWSVGRVGARGYAQRLREVADAIESSCPNWLDGNELQE